MSSMRFYYDPFSEFDRLFDDAFSSRFLRPVASPTTTDPRHELLRPKMDVHENFSTITATFELPGVKPSEVNIDIDQGRLIVSGETGTSQDHDAYTVRERSRGRFSRTLTLPQGTKPEEVKAKMENGLLNVSFPRPQDQEQPKRITIE